MPLPRENQVWPPDTNHWQEIYRLYAEWAAWYSGDPNQLAKTYSSMVYTPTQKGLHWSKEVTEERRTMLHIPLAGDIASTSADLLFSERPTIKIPEAHEENASSDAKKTQDRLDQILDEGYVYSRLIEAADACAGIGGVFIKPVWDRELAPYPILSIAQADNALPEFRHGILTAVTLWKEIEDGGNYIWRLVERHEVGPNGNSYILNGLYRGTVSNLGKIQPLNSMTETANEQEVIDTRIKGLAVRYVPNMKPNRRFRGSAIGQSDYNGVEGLMDALDEAWSSWMRDLRLGKGRVFVPEMFLEKDERTGDLKFDIDKEIFTALEMDPVSAKDAGFTPNQFKIRTQEHKDTCLELIDRIVGSAGYSPQSFGLKIEGRAESGTALKLRERRSFITASKKAMYWQPAIKDIVRMMLEIDRIHLGSGVQVLEPSVEIHDSVEQDQSTIAETVDMVNRAQSASTETRVRMLHPDWGKEQVDEEVQRIQEEQGSAMPNPDDVGVS